MKKKTRIINIYCEIDPNILLALKVVGWKKMSSMDRTLRLYIE
jgi:hypothetical protein